MCSKLRITALTRPVRTHFSLVNPAIALISVGADNKLGHPSQQVLDRLATHNCQIWRTDELGTIILSTDGDILQVSALGK